MSIVHYFHIKLNKNVRSSRKNLHTFPNNVSRNGQTFLSKEFNPTLHTNLTPTPERPDVCHPVDFKDLQAKR